jgi:hypothetical protein
VSQILYTCWKKQANRLFLLPLKTPFAEKPEPDCGYLLFICEEQHITGTIKRIAVTPAAMSQTDTRT